MNPLRSARHFVMHVREEGWKSIPPLLHTRWMVLMNLSVRREEASRRAAEETRYQTWIRRQEPDEAERARQGAHRFPGGLSILIPTYNTRPELLRALVDSLLAQTCPQWEACLYDGASPSEETRRALRAEAARDERIRVEFGAENLGISGNTNRALAMARAPWVALADHDDLLAPDAVYCVLRAAEDGADMVYSDEDKCDEAGERFFDPHLKSDFAPDTLRSGNYICHLMAMKKDLMVRAGALRSECDGSQDHDLALRASEMAGKITHIPRILYHWRMLNTSVSHQGAARCAGAAVRAVQDQQRRLGLPGQAYMDELRVRVGCEVPPDAAVSLIVAGSEKGTQAYLTRLSRRMTYQPAEVLAVGAGETVLRACGKACERIHGDSGLAAGLNLAARQAGGEYLLFMAQGVMPQSRTFVQELLEFAQRPDVGCVGTALMDRRCRYLHAGYAVDVPGGAVSYQAGASLYANPYMLTDRIVRNVTAVSAGLMMIRRDTFLRLGGFGDYADDLAAVSLGIRCLDAGLLNVYTPYARAVCRRLPPPCLTEPVRGEELARFRAWAGEHPKERYYSPLFEKKIGQMSLDTERMEETL